MNNYLNLVLFYYESIDKLKTKKREVIDKIVLSFNISWYLKILLAKVLAIVIDSEFFN